MKTKRRLAKEAVPAQASPLPPPQPATLPLQQQILNLAAWVEAIVDVVGMPQVMERLKERLAIQAAAAKTKDEEPNS